MTQFLQKEFLAHRNFALVPAALLALAAANGTDMTRDPWGAPAHAVPTPLSVGTSNVSAGWGFDWGFIGVLNWSACAAEELGSLSSFDCIPCTRMVCDSQALSTVARHSRVLVG